MTGYTVAGLDALTLATNRPSPGRDQLSSRTYPGEEVLAVVAPGL